MASDFDVSDFGWPSTENGTRDQAPVFSNLMLHGQCYMECEPICKRIQSTWFNKASIDAALHAALGWSICPMQTPSQYNKHDICKKSSSNGVGDEQAPCLDTVHTETCVSPNADTAANLEPGHVHKQSCKDRHKCLLSMTSSLHTHLEALPVNNRWTRLVILALGNPHLLEGGQGSKDRPSNPDRVLPLWWRHNLDLRRTMYT